MSTWDLDRVAPPWGERPSIYQHIHAHLRPEPGLAGGGNTLPDAPAQQNGGGRWAFGAPDGVFGHHVVPGPGDAAGAVLEQLRTFVRQPTDEHAATLYATLTASQALAYVYTLLDAVVEADDLNADSLHAVGSWLATRAADREPVKIGMALLGLITGGEDDRDILLTLGRHDEFTSLAADAIRMREPHPDRTLYALARFVSGWGRVHVVKHLAGTKDDEIRAWLLREGYRNNVSYEYTALICARTGGLLDALRLPSPDDALLDGAGDILSTLITGRGGPVSAMEAYEDGAEATLLYVGHLRARSDLALDHLLHVHTIREFLQEEDGVAHDPTLGWPERRTELLEHAEAVLGRPVWEGSVRAQLESTERSAFWTAAEAAKALGLDPWEHYFARVERGEDDWWWQLMGTDDAVRVARVVALAETRLPPGEIGTGPANALGLSPEYQAHMELDSVLQGLPQFPGLGWALIREGLRSPVIRQRNMALRALAGWHRHGRPADPEAMLRQAGDEEPDQDVAARIRRVLESEP